MNKVVLGDVVKRVKDKVDKNNTELEYYVAGEHFENGEIIISKKGNIEGSTIGPAFKMRFKPGHVLLMSRNPHLRKAGVVDFEGICSDVSYVCETKDESVLKQKFLPFLFQNNHFWAFAEANKKGSTNFFLNWSDFERYEFNLPDIKEQEKLAELLWAANVTKEAYKKLLALTDDLAKAQFVEMFGDPLKNPKEWAYEPLGKHAEILAGNPFKSQGYVDCGIKICGGLIIMPDRIVWEDAKHWPITDGLEKYLLHGEDIVLAMDRPWISSGFKIAMINPAELPALLIQRTARIRGTDLIQNYILWVLKNEAFLKHCNVTQTTVPHISMGDIKNYIVPIPPLEVQKQFSDFVNTADKSKLELKQTIQSLESIMKAIMNQYIV